MDRLLVKFMFIYRFLTQMLRVSCVTIFYNCKENYQMMANFLASSYPGDRDAAKTGPGKGSFFSYFMPLLLSALLSKMP
jgi:hypothetical protein